METYKIEEKGFVVCVVNKVPAHAPRDKGKSPTRYADHFPIFNSRSLDRHQHPPPSRLKPQSPLRQFRLRLLLLRLRLPQSRAPPLRGPQLRRWPRVPRHRLDLAMLAVQLLEVIAA